MQALLPRVAAGGVSQRWRVGRSSLREDSAAVLGLGAHGKTRYAGFARCARTVAVSQSTKRASTRAAPKPALLAAPQASAARHRPPLIHRCLRLSESQLRLWQRRGRMAGGAPLRSRGAQGFRPARAARIVI